MNLKAGFISLKTLVIIILIIVGLGMFGINLEEDVAGNEDVQDNVSYVYTGVRGFWNRYLSEPASYIWNDIFIELIWESFIVNMQSLRNGQSPTNFELQNNLPYTNIPDYIDQYQLNN
ncbi:MAG: hypothetical protein QG580_364 [Patescibacteria group bacterium]|jgi:hypothetical protein|nr:hypothetical protein [Patescibacteria group bacterium]